MISVDEEKVFENVAEGKLYIDLQRFNKGLYLIAVKSGDKTTCLQKIIIN